MASRGDGFLRHARGFAEVVGLVAAMACEPSEATLPQVRDVHRTMALQAQVQQLSAKVAMLEGQLLQEQRNAARARQETLEHRERIAALENQAVSIDNGTTTEPSPASVAATLQVEAELKVAYRALMRAIERLDISAEEKAMLKGSLRPTRSLDRDNPWSVATY